MARVLVTGAAGFLGSHLCDRLLEQGNTVIALDNLYTGRKENLPQHPQLTWLLADIIQPLSPEQQQHIGPVEQIYHLACPASPPHYQRDPLFTLKTSFLGTLNTLNLAENWGARILVASTSEVYGDPQVHPQPESYWGNVNPFGVRSCYDEGKRVSESLCFAFRERGVEVRIARIFNTYGPRMALDDGRVVSNLVVQALQGKPLTVYGTGSQTRSFCYVSDLVAGMMALMASGVSEPVNLGNPSEFTVLQLAEQVRGFIDPALPIQFLPLPGDDPQRRRPDITLAQTRLGWFPSVSLAEGLPLTIADFRRRLRA
ncbi:MAG: SDR family oxidoreductase [Thermostichales cyanobacterium BF4_bins_65]